MHTYNGQRNREKVSESRQRERERDRKKRGRAEKESVVCALVRRRRWWCSCDGGSGIVSNAIIVSGRGRGER